MNDLPAVAESEGGYLALRLIEAKHLSDNYICTACPKASLVAS